MKPSRRCVLNAVRLALMAIGALLLSHLLVVGGALCLVGIAKSHGGIGPIKINDGGKQ